MTALTHSDIIEALRLAIGSQTAASWAKANRISPQYLSDVLHRKREPGPKVLKALGVRAVRKSEVTYHPVRGRTVKTEQQQAVEIPEGAE